VASQILSCLREVRGAILAIQEANHSGKEKGGRGAIISSSDILTDYLRRKKRKKLRNAPGKERGERQ